MAKKNSNGGANGESGASAEVLAADVAASDGKPAVEQSVTGDAEGIPPDAQITVPVASMSTDELKASWAGVRLEIVDLDRMTAQAKVSLRVFEQELCERYKKVADVQGVEAVATIEGHRLKVKARPAKHGGGLHFVDAPISAAIEL